MAKCLSGRGERGGEIPPPVLEEMREGLEVLPPCEDKPVSQTAVLSAALDLFRSFLLSALPAHLGSLVKYPLRTLMTAAGSVNVLSTPQPD